MGESSHTVNQSHPRVRQREQVHSEKTNRDGPTDQEGLDPVPPLIHQMWWILPSQPTGYNPVGELSTGCGTLRQSHNANTGITGREAHKNDGSNANATMIYSNTHDDPKAYTHVPCEPNAGRAQSRPPGATMGGPVPNGPRSQARAASGPCAASLTALPLKGDPRPSRAEAGMSPRLPRFQDLPKPNTSGLIPRFFNFPG